MQLSNREPIKHLLIGSPKAVTTIRFFAHSQLMPTDKSGDLNQAKFKIYLSINEFRGLYHQGIIGQILVS